MTHVPPASAQRHPMPTVKTSTFGRAARTTFISVCLIAAAPLLLRGCGMALFFTVFKVDDFLNSGSATGQAAMDRCAPFLHGVSGWRSATNERAEWTASDFHGDNSEHFAFTIPLEDVAAVEASMRQIWDSNSGVQRDEMPTSNDVPTWWSKSLPDGIYFEEGFDSIGISRTTGLVQVRHWAW